MHRLVKKSVCLLALPLLIASPIFAQVDYDAANRVYLVTGDATIDTNLSGNEVFVGKDNYANFATLPGTITLTVNDPAVINGFNYRPFADGINYFGLNVVGAHIANINGGVVGDAYGFNTGTINVNGGIVGGLHGYGNSALNVTNGMVGFVEGTANSTTLISGGMVLSNLTTLMDATATITGGSVLQVLANGGLITVSGGTVSTATATGSGQLTFTGSGLTVNSLGESTFFTGADNLIGTSYTLTGTLTSGDLISLPVFGGDTATGDLTQRTFNGAIFAPDLYLTTDTTVNSVVNRVVIGRDATQTINTSPTVTLDSGANTGFVNAFNSSSVVVNGATVNGGLTLSDNSSADIGAGTVDSVSAFNNSAVNITGGNVTTVLAMDSSTVNIGGGTVMNASSFLGNSVINVTAGNVTVVSSGGNTTGNISGGTVSLTQSYENGSIHITGGTVAMHTSLNTSTATVSGGTVQELTGAGSSIVYVTGGTAPYVLIRDSNTTNLSGGNIGGLDANTADPDYIGLYLTGGTLNLYGSDFLRNDITAGIYRGIGGTYGTLTGTLLDGSALNTTFFIATGVDFEEMGGGSQDNPLLPDSNQDGIFTFNGVPTDGWFDPPSVDSFLFTMTDGHTFTHILDFPTGFESLFTVTVDGNILGQFGAGQEVDFAAFGFAEGVTAFTVSGIDPLVDAEDPEGFPIRLRFNAPFASFTMQGLGGNSAAPEPGTIGFLMVGIGALGIAFGRRRY